MYVVDHDASVRRLLSAVLASVSIPTHGYASGTEFLRDVNMSYDGCVLMDVRMPGISGIEVCEHLRRRRLRIPVILLSEFADAPMVIRSMRAGAIDFIQKPFNPQELLDRIQRIFADNDLQAAQDILREAEDESSELLTRRERQVLELALTGKRNKEIADELGIGLRTIETHRSRVMQKLGCKSVLELVRRFQA
ncbi:MAG: response regulator [Candidatus Accumulibacter sp. UW26]